MGPGAAEAAARTLIEAGCDGLISFGLAGALSSELEPGSVVIPDEVVADVGGWAPTDPAWRERLLGRLAAGGVAASGGRLYGSDQPVLTAEGKRELAISTGASAIDMESHAVARVAREAGRPFLVIRAVLDPLRASVPTWLPSVVDDSGRPKITAVVRGCLLHPRDLPYLIGLARSQHTGLASLRRVALHAGPLFALG